MITTAIPALGKTNFASIHNPAQTNLQQNSQESLVSVAKHLKLNLSENANSQLTNPQALLERGRILFDSERFAEAVQIWEQAEKSFERQKDISNKALSLNYLSLAYQNLGEWQKAETGIAKSLNLLQQEKDNAAVLAVVLNTKGSLQLAKGETETALETWNKAEIAYKAADDKSGEIGSK